jgi:2-polyprenyl-6-methoxyphenol hydroxylase-like FAD-dependent oxidoreductase
MTALVRPLPAGETSQCCLHVLIIGGGIGGLTLAQGLKRSGVGVAVYERDRTRTDRVQGYRVHINPAGSLALHACLPPPLFRAFEQTCGKPGRGINFLTERMKVLMSIDAGFLAHEGVARHRSVSRITLRQVLLSGLDDVVQFGKAFTHCEECDGRVIAHFDDGTSAEGDVLVAADGGGSRVRRQFLPQAERIDTGVVGIAGKAFLDDATRAALAPRLLDGLALVAAPGGLGLFVALQQLNDAAEHGIGGNDEAARAVPGVHFDNATSYLMWALSGTRERLGVGADAETLDHAALAAVASRAMAGWSRELRDLVRLADPTTLSCIAIRTSVPIAPWTTQRITLIGDAIHSMTPYRGIGANIALKDAVRLRDALVAADRGERPLIEAVHAYEAEMLDYGFKAVRNSLRAMQQTTAATPFARALSRTAFRIIDRVPPVKRWLAQRMGNE